VLNLSERKIASFPLWMATLFRWRVCLSVLFVGFRGEGLPWFLFLDCSRRPFFEAADLVTLRGRFVPALYLPNGVGKGASGRARSEMGQDD